MLGKVEITAYVYTHKKGGGYTAAQTLHEHKRKKSCCTLLYTVPPDDGQNMLLGMFLDFCLLQKHTVQSTYVPQAEG